MGKSGWNDSDKVTRNESPPNPSFPWGMCMYYSKRNMDRIQGICNFFLLQAKVRLFLKEENSCQIFVKNFFSFARYFFNLHDETESILVLSKQV